MARPEVNAATEVLYEALEPAFTDGDEERSWTTLKLCSALVGEDLGFIYDIVTENDGTPGWQILLDVDRCPAPALPYLAQFVGVRIRPDMSEGQIRAAIRNPEGFGRGTVAQIEAVAKRRLTGSKVVTVTERYGSFVWRIRVETLESETPEPTRTQAEIIAEAKPIGILMFFNTKATATWLGLRTAKATWLKTREDYATWYITRTT